MSRIQTVYLHDDPSPALAKLCAQWVEKDFTPMFERFIEVFGRLADKEITEREASDLFCREIMARFHTTDPEGNWSVAAATKRGLLAFEAMRGNVVPNESSRIVPEMFHEFVRAPNPVQAGEDTPEVAAWRKEFVELMQDQLDCTTSNTWTRQFIHPHVQSMFVGFVTAKEAAKKRLKKLEDEKHDIEVQYQNHLEDLQREREEVSDAVRQESECEMFDKVFMRSATWMEEADPRDAWLRGVKHGRQYPASRKPRFDVPTSLNMSGQWEANAIRIINPSVNAMYWVPMANGCWAGTGLVQVGAKVNFNVEKGSMRAGVVFEEQGVILKHGYRIVCNVGTIVYLDFVSGVWELHDTIEKLSTKSGITVTSMDGNHE